LPHLFHVRASDGTLLDGAPLLTESAMEEVDMAHASSSKTDKIEHPQEHYETPDDLRIAHLRLRSQLSGIAIPVFEERHPRFDVVALRRRHA
jgi:hypothetical protein